NRPNLSTAPRTSSFSIAGGSTENEGVAYVCVVVISVSEPWPQQGPHVTSPVAPHVPHEIVPEPPQPEHVTYPPAHEWHWRCLVSL
ncbi:MAG TPA: hypothetical protein VFS24_17995, partial [Steroidobacteraceae bacterium]|nr:hypothetical protein [Steroidobacteraceae bacterium]